MVGSEASYVGRCLVRDDGARLEALDLLTGAHTRLEGRLRAAALGEGGACGPLWATALAVEPALRALDDALRAPRPTRAELLRGTGFGLLFVELTAQCNERCTHCYADAAPERTETLSRDAVRDVLAQGRALGFPDVQFTGGDPLLHPALLELVDDARALGFERVELFTNGLALDPPRVEALAQRGVCLAFSVYSEQAAAHDAVTRTPNSHARTLRAIERARAADMPVRVAVTAMDGVPCDPDALRALLEALGVPAGSVRFTQSRAVGRGTRATGGLDDGSRHGLASKERSGKACVSSGGVIFPCIFGRALPLGALEDGLAAALVSAPGELPDAARFARALDAAEDHFGCLECRIRAAAWSGPSRLPQLPRGAA